MKHDLQDFIGVFDNEDMDDFCNLVIEMVDVAESQNALTTRQQESPETSKSDKDDSFIFAEQFSNGEEVSSYFYNKFWNVWYPEYVKKYSLINSLGRHVCNGFKLQKTEPGQGYHLWHCEADSSKRSHRLLAWVLYLNDVEDGGETEFLYQHRRVKPKKGRFVLWPAAFTHTHRGNPPLSGTKYIATGWVVFES
jgi:hypothetical protein